MVKRKTNSPAYHYQGHWKTMLWYRRSPKIYAKATKDTKPFDEKDPFHFLLGIDFNKDNASINIFKSNRWAWAPATQWWGQY